MTRFILALLSVTLPFCAQDSWAQTPDTTTAVSLEGVTVTVTRDVADARDVTQRVEVVPIQEMREAGASDVAEGLRATTPIDVISYPGLLTGISLRGFRPQITGINPSTMILVNGRPAGTANLTLLPLAAVQRV